MERIPLHLLVIDPQNDFCDLPAAWVPPAPPGLPPVAPALPVAGAHADMLRLAGFIDAAAPWIGAVTVTLDSHQRLDIAHPTFWQDADGAPVPPFTALSAASLRAGGWRPRDPAARDRAIAYAEALEARGRYRLMVWPVHCEIGTWGHGVHPAVLAACHRWEDARAAAGGAVRLVPKGTNPWTEHYSALQAEVPDAAAPETLLDRGLVARLAEARTIAVAGEAASHCVRATVEDLLANLPAGWDGEVVLLADCTSPVAGFAAEGEAFAAAMRAGGASGPVRTRAATAAAFAAELRGRA
ncbi:MAG: cysteine hydrolase [Xylophilus ampelinus]